MTDALAVAHEVPRTLDEAASKELLCRYGVPVVDEEVAGDAEQAVAAAGRLGYPVVLKALGERITHKSERGLVRLGLTGRDAVAAAANELREAAGDALGGLVRDRLLGPAVMFGVGGILAEALGDVTFRLAPLARRDALSMLGEIRAASLLDRLRGEEAVDRDALVGCLMGLSRLAEERPDVAEVDVNPLLVGPDGRVAAVDALVRLGPAEPEDGREQLTPERLGPLFYPRSLVLVGASATLGKWGHLLLTNILAGGYRGEVHLVNPRGGTIAGLPVHRSVDEVPGPVDLAVVTVPAAAVEPLIPALAAKGARGLVVVSSGFAETGEEGRRLEERLVRAAREAGLPLIGPNTMGICNPHRDFYCTGSHVRPPAGGTALLAQSGNMGTQLLAFAEQQGIGIRAFCGSGNEGMVSLEDYMAAFEVDDATRSVVLYAEGLRNGRRFFRSARRVGRVKPVVVLKGGRTKEGARAAASHTGALASDSRLFSAACRQAGLVEVRRPMELLDLSAAFSSLPLPAGDRVAIVTLGGGWGVVAADLCAEYGLQVPGLDESITGAIDALLPSFWSRSNPVDLVGQIDARVAMTVTEVLARWEGCDAVLNLGLFGQRLFFRWMLDSSRASDPGVADGALDGMERMAAEGEAAYVRKVADVMEETGKPVVGVKLLEDRTQRTVFDVEGRRHPGVFFPTPERAVRVLAGMWQYASWRRQELSGG